MNPMLYTRVTEVTVCALPEDHPEHRNYAVRVRWADGEQYMVEQVPGGHSAGTWDYDTAYRLACECAPLVTVNGRTATQVLETIHGANWQRLDDEEL